MHATYREMYATSINIDATYIRMNVTYKIWMDLFTFFHINAIYITYITYIFVMYIMCGEKFIFYLRDQKPGLQSALPHGLELNNSEPFIYIFIIKLNPDM